jgi:DnaJ-domain-containing protein 1
MAVTPKIFRKNAKRVQKEVTNYFGFPVRAKVNFGGDSFSQTHLRGNKFRGTIVVNKKLKGEKIPVEELKKFLKHEYFHIAADGYTLKNARTTFGVVSEAIAMISNAEAELKTKNPAKRAMYIDSLEFDIRFNPSPYPIHHLGLVLMVNILKKFPSFAQRRAHVKYLLKQNSQALNAIREKKARFVGLGDFGEIITQKI